MAALSEREGGGKTQTLMLQFNSQANTWKEVPLDKVPESWHPRGGDVILNNGPDGLSLLAETGNQRLLYVSKERYKPALKGPHVLGEHVLVSAITLWKLPNSVFEETPEQ